MNLPVVLALCFTIASALKYEESLLEHATVVNAKNAGWKAGFNPRFSGMDWKDIKSMLGAKLDRPAAQVKHVEVKDVLPATFDARSYWTSCTNRISKIRDQSQCGGCWAVSAAIVASDRTCILTSAQTNLDLSAEDLLACCGDFCGYGCDGGYPIRAMEYWQNTGLVTGGNYGDTTTCAPYGIRPCDPTWCESQSTPACVKKCSQGYYNTWTNDKHFASSSYYVQGGAAAIQQEILTNGPVQAAFQVYSDFMHYTSGVYQHVTGALEGGHAVTIIGWGTENGIPYWLVKNQWGTTWGDNGLFKIRRGTNECDFEAGVVAGIPKDDAIKKQMNPHKRSVNA